MKSIAGYNVIKLLAKGGMAAIYLAEQESLQRQVVLKFLNPKLDDAVRKRFIDEGRIIASLKHPNIITVFDVVSTEKYNFLTMEYLPDGDLETRLLIRLDTFTALKIISEISDALHLVHKQGIIHGDIKPANVLFRGADCPILTDFGISHQIEPKKEVDLNSGDLYASPTYASPELIQGKPFDYRTDIYSLGIMLYEMLLGEKPFTGETEIETIANSIQEPVPKLPEALQGLQPLLESLLAKSPDNRLSDTKLVTRFIVQYLKDHPKLTRQSSESKLIDTDVVVEYIAKNKANKQKKANSNYLSSLILTVILLSTLWFNKETLWQQYFTAPSFSVPQRQLFAEQPGQQQSNITDAEDADSKLAKQEFVEQQNLLKQKDNEIAQIKKELEVSKKRAKQQQLNRKTTIDGFIRKGTASLKKYHLTTPLNDNALYYFQKVIELDKNNPDAQKGINDVIYRYELLARSELDKYQYQKAQSYISTGLSIDYENERLLALQKQANIQNEPRRVINRVKGFFNNL